MNGLWGSGLLCAPRCWDEGSLVMMVVVMMMMMMEEDGIFRGSWV